MIFLLCTMLLVVFLYYFFINNKFSMFIFIFTIAMDKISITIGGITFTIGMIMAILTILKFLFTGISIRNNIFKNKFFLIFTILMYALIISSTISALFSIDQISALAKTAQLFFLWITVYIIYMYCEINSTEEIMKLLIISGMINLILAIAQFIGYYLGVDVNTVFSIFERLNGRAYYGISMVEIAGSIVPRMNGFFVDPAPFGGYMLTIACLIFVNNIERMNIMKILYTAMFIITVILSFSRSAWLGLLITFIVLIYIINRKRINGINKINLSIIVIGIVLLIVFRKNIYIVLERALQTFNSSDISTSGHKNMAIYAIDAFKSSPMFGLGLNNFKDFVGFNTMTHSMYLTFLCETGIIGFGLYFSIWTIIVTRLRKIIKKTILNKEAIAIWIILISILASNIGYDYYNQLFIWIYIGLGIFIIDKNRRYYGKKQMARN